MGFQGDVAGLGLGELLQGLARGGREGVLTLRGGSTGATLGVEGGQIFLLPEPDEDPEIWRKRCNRAWVKDPDERIDVLRMSEIAYADRLERVFALLDAPGVHFRFEEGQLPQPTDLEVEEVEDGGQQLGRMETGGRKVEVRSPVHCPGVSVEFLLLEFARLTDEGLAHGDARELNQHHVPSVTTTEPPSKDVERFWSECDGMSSVLEICDRLGWPLRQGQAMVVELGVGGHIRLSSPQELLALCQSELGHNRFARAASRLTAWCRCAPPGPPPVEDVQLLLAEWQRAKLPATLASMKAPDARTLLRRIEWVEGDATAAIARWRELRRYHKHDRLSEVRQVHLQSRSPNEADAPALGDVLKLSRKFHDAGQKSRSTALLKVAATCQPETTSMRLELGQRLVAADLLQEGAPWIVDACRSLIENNHPGKAVGPLKMLIAAMPGNREARALLGVAHTRATQSKRKHRNVLIGLATILVVSLGAMVKLRHDRSIDDRLAQIAEMAEEPMVALAALDADFPGDKSAEVLQMRQRFVEAINREGEELTTQWLEGFQECQLECTLGDPIIGLQRALDLPTPPNVPRRTTEPWPTADELLASLAARLEQAGAELGPPDEADPPDVLHDEQRQSTLIEQLLELTEGREGQDVSDFRDRLEALSLTLIERSETRAGARRTRLARERLERQDMLLAAAREHAKAGDLERSVRTYRELVDMDDSDRVASVLAEEIAEVESHFAALVDARELARAGRHREAIAGLESAGVDPRDHLLPWRLETRPSGVRVRFADGSSRITPFVMETAVGEVLDLSFELAGHEPKILRVEGPADQDVRVPRLPERWWRSETPVEAVPVSVEDDHVVANRGGELARLVPGDRPAWTVSLESLGGVGRTPVFLPRRQGELLVLTEDGAAFLVDASNGHIEGPWSLESPPRWGPRPTASGVVAGFLDGSRAVWEGRLRPEVEANANPGDPDGHGSNAGMEVLRRRAEHATELPSPWGPLTVRIDEDHFLVQKRGEEVFCVSREGEWEFVAWEAPNSKIPDGRLWVSDRAGLRAFQPND